MSGKGAAVTGDPRTGAPAQPTGPQSGKGSGWQVSGNPHGAEVRPTSVTEDTGKKQPQPYTSPAPPERSAKSRENG